MSGQYVRSFLSHRSKDALLGICHLLDTLLFELALRFLGSQEVHLSLLGSADDQLEELLMVPNRIVDQREIS